MSMTRQELIPIGQKNLRILIDEIGSERDFEDLMGWDKSYLWSWFKKNPPQSISRNSAKKIEVAFDKPEGWLHDFHTVENESGEPIKKKAKRRNKNPEVETDSARARHDILDQMAAQYITDTGKRLGDSTIIDLMQWSYGKTLL